MYYLRTAAVRHGGGACKQRPLFLYSMAGSDLVLYVCELLSIFRVSLLSWAISMRKYKTCMK